MSWRPELTSDEIQEAYQNLTEEEKAKIDSLVEKLIDKFRKKRGERNKYYFGRAMALELIAKTGIWMIEFTGD